MPMIELTQEADGTLTFDGEAVTCSWFALCENPATLVVDHPVLGGVPSCVRCQERCA